MHRLSSSFVLGYHGCDREVGEALLRGEPFRVSENDYDWLGPGVYFWESNPRRGLEFAREGTSRFGSSILEPFVVGAVVEMGLCLDLTTSTGIDELRAAYRNLTSLFEHPHIDLPRNSADGLRRYLDCAAIRRFHGIRTDRGLPPVDTVKGLFTEGGPAYPGSGFSEKTHVQIAVRNLDCIKGIFRVRL